MDFEITPEIEEIIKASGERIKRQTELMERLTDQIDAVLSSVSAANPDVVPWDRSHAAFYASCLYNASLHFVHVSRFAEDIANAPHIHIQVDTLIWLSEMPAWEEAVRFWGYTGDPKLRLDLPTTVPVPLREVFLLQKVFQKHGDVRFVTYHGIIDSTISNVGKYEIFLTPGRRLKKHDVILAFPRDRMRDVQKSIKRRKNVADLGLPPIHRLIDRPKIAVAGRVGDTIECVMRNGLVFRGENICISKYNIVVRVGGKKGDGGKVILVYRHALQSFSVLKASPPDPAFRDDFDEESEVGDIATG